MTKIDKEKICTTCGSKFIMGGNIKVCSSICKRIGERINTEKGTLKRRGKQVDSSDIDTMKIKLLKVYKQKDD